jgi:hypothetical protein
VAPVTRMWRDLSAIMWTADLEEGMGPLHPTVGKSLSVTRGP